MPFHKPIPGQEKNGSFASGAQSGLKSVVQVEKIAQIAIVLPCAVLVGWLGGAWLDGHFHQSWMTLTGFVLGSIAGMTSAIRLAIAMVNTPQGKQQTPTSNSDPNGSQ